MAYEKLCFKIDQTECGTAVEEITEDEYARIYTVQVMEQSLRLRKEVFSSYPKENTVERIMEQFIRDRIPVAYVEKIVSSEKLLPYFSCYSGIEVSVDSEGKWWIFDGIVPIEFNNEFNNDMNDYEIHMK